MSSGFGLTCYFSQLLSLVESDPEAPEGPTAEAEGEASDAESTGSVRHNYKKTVISKAALDMAKSNA